MEIGISSERLIEIGLNMAGFLSSGLLVIVLHSIFRKRHRVRSVKAVDKAGLNLIAKKQFNAKSATKIEPEVEFINLRRAAWKSQKTDEKVPGDLKNSTTKKQEVIRMANKLLASKRKADKGKRNVEGSREELSVDGGNFELQTAGRIKL